MEASVMRPAGIATLSALVTVLGLLVAVVGAGIAGGSVSAAKQTTIRFSVSEKGHRSLSKGRELTRVSGSGTLTLGETPQVNVSYNATSANGTIVFHRWDVVAGRVIDENNLSLNVTSATYRFTKTTSTAVVLVSVTKTDAKETDSCPVGTTGDLGLLDGRAGQPDDLGVNRLCGQRDIDYGGIKGRRAEVTITVKPETP
jgi:hypothetical protein